MGKFQVSTAEKKILVSFCYFTLLHISSSTLSVHVNNTSANFGIRVISFFLCARYSDTCLKPDFAEIFHPAATIVIQLVNACLPIFLLVYVIDCQVLKHNIRKARETIRIESAFASSRAQVGWRINQMNRCGVLCTYKLFCFNIATFYWARNIIYSM